MMLPADLPAEMTPGERDLLETAQRAERGEVWINPTSPEFKAARMLAARGHGTLAACVFTLAGQSERRGAKKRSGIGSDPLVRDLLGPITLRWATIDACARAKSAP